MNEYTYNEAAARRHARAARRREARLIALAIAVEVVGFSAIVVLELLK